MNDSMDVAMQNTIHIVAYGILTSFLGIPLYKTSLLVCIFFREKSVHYARDKEV